MVGSTAAAYKGWLKANIFVDNSFPLSGQLPPHPHLSHDPLLDDEMSVVISTIFQRMWVLVIKLADDIIEKSCERKGLFQVSSLPKKIQYLRPENIYGREQKTNLRKVNYHHPAFWKVKVKVKVNYHYTVLCLHFTPISTIAANCYLIRWTIACFQQMNMNLNEQSRVTKSYSHLDWMKTCEIR